MVIVLYSQELLNDFRAKSHYELSNIADVEARYRVEAGTEKMDEILRCVSEGVSRLYHRCWRFLREQIDPGGDDATSLPDMYRFDFIMSERRAIGKTTPIKEAMHTFVVEYAMSKFNSDMSMQDLSNKHSMLAMEAGERIDDMLFAKLPPRL